MYIGIMCGSYDTANLESRLSNSEVVSSLVKRDYTFVMGSGETGSMRDAKEIIRENDSLLMIIGSKNELDRTKSSKTDIKIEVSSTFERLNEIYKNCDVIIFLDGGIGTLSEFTSFLNNKIETQTEKKRINNDPSLILFNPNGLYNYLLKDMELRKASGLIDSNYKSFFAEANNVDELLKLVDEATLTKDDERSKLR